MATPTQFAYRTAKSVGIVDATPLYEPLPRFQRPEGILRCCVYSPCGRFFAWASPDCVTVIDASTGDRIALMLARNVFELGFSPLGTFIITWQRPSRDENGDQAKNLMVWRAIEEVPFEADGDEHNIVGRFVQKSQTGWNLQYTYDEKYCAREVANEVQFYQSEDLGRVWSKLRVEGVADFAISPGDHHSIAVFIPERKGQPAAVKVFKLPNFESAVCQKNFFKGDKVQLKWNDEGTSLIVLAQTEVDKSGKSYYGETTLYLLSAHGDFDSRIGLDKDGPIHDVTWSPNSKEFGVVYGYMPAKTTIFNTRAVATHSFSLGPRNTILFSPHGRFVLVAGFGNLAGQMDVYDLGRGYQKICTIEASNASVCQWSPDGKHILTATTSPRLRVDNGVRIWHVGGGLMYNEELQELYNVMWRPQSPNLHLLEDPSYQIPNPHESALAYLDTVKTPSKPAGAYRPPGARGQITPLAFKREDEGGAAYTSNGSLSLGGGVNGFGKPRKRVVPGAEVISENVGGLPKGIIAESDEALSKAALKNKKKREAKKAKEAVDKISSLAPEVEGDLYETMLDPSKSVERRDRKTHERNRSKSNIDSRPRSHQGLGERRYNDQNQSNPQHIASLSTVIVNATPTSTETPDLTVTSSSNGGSPQDKKIRALLKKLRAIDDLKMRRAGGERLEGTQIKKMDTEDGVRKELQALGWSD